MKLRRELIEQARKDYLASDLYKSLLLFVESRIDFVVETFFPEGEEDGSTVVTITNRDVFLVFDESNHLRSIVNSRSKEKTSK